MINLWAAEWHSKCLLDGEERHIINGQDCLPVLFRTRKRCKLFIAGEYGYIADRPDLRAEPHGWRMPQPVKVNIVKVSPLQG